MPEKSNPTCPPCPHNETSVEVCAARGGPCAKVTTNHEHGRVGLAAGIGIGVAGTLLFATGIGGLAALAWGAATGGMTYLLTQSATSKSASRQG